jgi:hypothetical protein
MPYTTQAKVEHYLGYAIAPAQSGEIATWIALAKEWIDNYTGSDFDQTVASDRYFDGNGAREIMIDEFTGAAYVYFLDGLGNIESTLSTTVPDFYTAPYNDTVKNRIVLSTGGGYATFPRGVKNIKINANWGQSSVPASVEMAATKIVGKIVDRGIKGGEGITAERLGEYNVSFGTIDEFADVLGIKDLLWPFKQMDL